ncbi:MAG: lipid A deacylase LpxR family protein [Thiohalomonadales bacterium]
MKILILSLAVTIRALFELVMKSGRAMAPLILTMLFSLSSLASVSQKDPLGLQANNSETKVSASEPVRIALLMEEEKQPLRVPQVGALQSPPESSWAFYMDNDVFIPSTRDRDYTGGMSFTRSSQQVAPHILSLDSLLAKINNLLGIDETEKTLFGYEMGLTAFTPEDIEAVEAQHDDRPYAGLIYTSNSRQNIRPQQRSSIISSLTIGVLGLDLVGDFQNAIHKNFSSRQAKGWHNQISEGGEMTFRYSVSQQNIQQSNYARGRANYEIKTSRKASLGYISDVSWSVSGRLGRLQAPWWTFNPQTSEYAEKSSPTTIGNSLHHRKEFYIWAGLSVRLRLYNALLQGQFRDSVVTYSSDELNHVLGEGWLGVTKEFGDGFRFSYFIRGQTKEIKYGRGARNLVWGGIIVSQTI